MKYRMMALLVTGLLVGCAHELSPDVRAGGAAVVPVATRGGAEARGDFLRMLERPRVEANVKAEAAVVSEGYSQEAFSYDAEKGQRVPGILVKKVGAVGAGGAGAASAPGKMPVVIYLHGTGGKKEDGLAVLHAAADRGMIGVAIDGRYHGARAAAYPKEGAMNAYETAIYRVWKANDPAVPPAAIDDGPKPAREHPLFYDTVWDIMRLIDYLVARPDVDASRIGLYGVSKGGIEAYLAAAVDTRIAAAVPCISVESFSWALENDQWKPRVETFQKAFDAAAKDAGVAGGAAADKKFVRQFYDRVMPGMTGEFDGPSMVPLIAPRALLAINGEKDPRTQPPALKLATDAAAAAYKAAGAEEKFVVMIQPNTPHQVKPEAQAAGVEFLAKWLKK